MNYRVAQDNIIFLTGEVCVGTDEESSCVVLAIGHPDKVYLIRMENLIGVLRTAWFLIDFSLQVLTTRIMNKLMGVKHDSNDG